MHYLLVLLMLVVACFCGQVAHAAPYDICADPGGGLPAGYQINQRSVFTAHGERWFCVVTPPSYSSSGPDYPLLVVFHGGDGNPQIMMSDNKDIIREGFNANGGDGYVMAFATGLPKDQCNFADLPCEHNDWGDDANIGFINDIIDYATGFNLDEDRIFLAGFSGGARLIYRAIAENDFSQPINGIATVAGGIGAVNTEEPENGLTLVNLLEGSQVHAMVMQGEQDRILNFAGGLWDKRDKRVMHVSFPFKVDLFRVLTGNENDTGDSPPSSVSLPSFSSLPTSRVATHYTAGNHQVMAISDENTQHIWPDWFSPLMFEFFDTL